MTISSLVRSAGPFVGNGVTTAFPFLYKVFSKANVIATLTVIATGVETALVVDVDFTVALNADQDASPGGTVTYNPSGVAMPATQKLTLTSGVPLLQTLALTIGGGFSPSAISAALDRAIICLQQISLTIGRGLAAAVSDTAPGPLPTAAARANNYLAFDASGNPVASSGLASSPVSTAMAPVVTAATIAAGRVALGPPGANELGFTLINGKIVPSVAGSALALAIKTNAGNDPSATDPVTVVFRSATAATGDYTALQITAANSLVISSGSTMGATNNVALRLWLVGFNDAGTFRMGAVNCLSGTSIMPLRDDILASSIAEGGAGAADSAQVIYTGTLVAAKAMRVLGYVEYSAGLAAVGTYGIVPTKVHLHAPGNSLPGQVVQTVRTDTGAVATGATVILGGDTVPQNTEGDQFMSQAITPTSAANILETKAIGTFASTATGDMQAMLFRDATAGALASIRSTTPGANSEMVLPLNNRTLAGSTAATTMKVRAGEAAANTTTFNGFGGARKSGGVFNSYIQVDEVMA